MPVKKTWIAFVVGAAFLAGCGKESGSAYPVASGPNKAGTPAEQPKVEEKVEPVLTLSGELAKMPEELKTDAFYYYGLSNDKPIPMKVTQPGQDATVSTVSVRVVSVSQDEVKFTVDRTGVLAGALGSQDLVLKKDGLYTVAVNGEARKKPTLELPSQLSPGKAWNSDETINSTQGPLRMISQQKVAGIEKIKTDVGEFEAIRIETTGTMELGGKKSSSTASLWLVKGLGLVKMTGKTKDASGKEQTMILEVTKPSNP